VIPVKEGRSGHLVEDVFLLSVADDQHSLPAALSDDKFESIGAGGSNDTTSGAQL